MKAIVHKANTRGYFDHGWLQTAHTFSFADYYDPERVHFGALRVLNDDRIAPGTGFGMHAHRNMEIVSIPLRGGLEHRDSMGHVSVLHKGEVQVMSAGTGVHHSLSKDETTEFLQIWVVPAVENVEPRYVNAPIEKLIVPNQISTIVYPYSAHHPEENEKRLWIYQRAWFSIAKLDKGKKVHYRLYNADSFGVYLFVINGAICARKTRRNRNRRRRRVRHYRPRGFDRTADRSSAGRITSPCTTTPQPFRHTEGLFYELSVLFLTFAPDRYPSLRPAASGRYSIIQLIPDPCLSSQEISSI